MTAGPDNTGPAARAAKPLPHHSSIPPPVRRALGSFVKVPARKFLIGVRLVTLPGARSIVHSVAIGYRLVGYHSISNRWRAQ